MADDTQQKVDQQNAENYQDDEVDGGGEPVDIDKLHADTFGEEHHTDQSVHIADEIDGDQRKVNDGPAPIGSDVPDDEEE